MISASSYKFSVRSNKQMDALYAKYNYVAR